MTFASRASRTLFNPALGQLAVAARGPGRTLLQRTRVLSAPSPWGYEVAFNEVSRDASQSKYANRIPLAIREQLAIFELWNKLNQLEGGRFGAIESGGASVQVEVNFLRRDYTETARSMRAAAPDTPIRPLWRGANSFLLKPAHVDDLGFLLEQFARDAAPIGGKAVEGLRIKAFDSQGQMKELASTARKIAELREKGHAVTMEVAIPYSNGEGRDTYNPYPNSLFVQKAAEAYEMATQAGLPPEAISISLKDMVGELDEKTAYELTQQIIHGLKERGVQVEIGIHSHDTGLALRACVGAIRAAHEENWPINVDTVGGSQSGFVNTLELVQALEAENLPTGVNEAQKVVLREIDTQQDALRAAYKPARVVDTFSGEDLRHYGIAGGGETSFVAAVKASGLDKNLDIPMKDVLHLAGHALRAVSPLMGHAFPVTPGFQNKQIAALNLLNNMVATGYLKPGMSREEMEAKVVAPLDDKQIQDFFLNKLDDVVRKFLQGEMPVEPPQVVRDALGRRTGLLTDGIPSMLEDAKKAVEKAGIKGYSANAAIANALIIGPHWYPVNARVHLPEADPRQYPDTASWNEAKAEIAQGLPERAAAARANQFFVTEKGWRLINRGEAAGAVGIYAEDLPQCDHTSAVLPEIPAAQQIRRPLSASQLQRLALMFPATGDTPALQRAGVQRGRLASKATSLIPKELQAAPARSSKPALRKQSAFKAPPVPGTLGAQAQMALAQKQGWTLPSFGASHLMPTL